MVDASQKMILRNLRSKNHVFGVHIMHFWRVCYVSLYSIWLVFESSISGYVA
jgi:hypothetical protein